MVSRIILRAPRPPAGSLLSPAVQHFLLPQIGPPFKAFNIDTRVKNPDAALRFILSHCGVQQVRLIPSDLRALPANFLRARLKYGYLLTFYDFINVALKKTATCASKHKREGRNVE